MARDINPDKPLTDKDRQYLLDRGQEQRVVAHDARFGDEYSVEDLDDRNGPEGPEEEGDEYDAWTAAELQDEAVKRGLSKAGKKDELIARLREDDENSPL
jgi:hypothetical protein